MKKVIITTTIRYPTEALKKFSKLDEWQLIVIGDLKTPEDFNLENALYVSPKMQEEYDKELSDAIGWNSIQRRNFGLLWAHDMGANIIATIDDDNIPYDCWGENLLIGKNIEVTVYHTDSEAFDPVGCAGYPQLWHRGFPLELLSSRDYSKKEMRKIKVDIQADFWDEDPDIDAICRLQFNPKCYFDEKYFPFTSTVFTPFNSQNTFLHNNVLKDYFLFPHIGRMDDIWAAYYTQSTGHKIIFNKPSVKQVRNKHDLIEDMKLEYIGYENNLKLISDLKSSSQNILNYLPEKSLKAWGLYKAHFK